MITQLKSNWKLFLIASLTLGLAPFSPPHIWGKLQWIAGGGAFSGEAPMQAIDWFDFLMHGAPWLLLIVSGILNLVDYTKTKA
ncbi:MAG: hypothetical protein R3279_02475 [Putridiphycobacter sp.]|jgi:hypothetical protein|nr:hypothetical protein [Putridiphycobacter sp.]